SLFFLRGNSARLCLGLLASFSFSQQTSFFRGLLKCCYLGLAETSFGFLGALELSCLCFSQGLNPRFESLFCFCSLLRFCCGLPAEGFQLGQSFFFLLSQTMGL